MKHLSSILIATMLLLSARVKAEVDPAEYAARLAEFETEMVASLRACSSLAEIEKLLQTEYMGLVFTLGDGSWIAVLYRDTHFNMICSCSIALCSDGTWMQSEYHFCGNLPGYAHGFRRKLADMASDKERLAWLEKWEANEKAWPGMIRALYEADSSGTLDEARRSLSKIGFKIVQPKSRQQEYGEPSATDNPDDAHRLREDH